jgi:hypothetical protein
MTTMTTVIGMVDSAEIGRKLIAELVEAGLPNNDIEILEGDQEEVLKEIVERGFDEQIADGYVQSIDDGKILVAAWAPDEQVDRAVAIMGSYETPEDKSGVEKLLEVAEELTVNKRRVAQGGVRVTRNVTETPVEETVRLRTRAGRGRSPAGRAEAERPGSRCGFPGEDGGDGGNDGRGRGHQGGPCRRRGLAQEAGRGA